MMAELEKRTLLFTVDNEVGALLPVLTLFKECKISLSHLESRKGPLETFDFISILTADESQLKLLMKNMSHHAKDFKLLNADNLKETMPWFPRKISDLDVFSKETLEYGGELSADHPGFSDEAYRKRRLQISSLATHYRHGQPIPRVEYTREEIETWRAVYRKLTTLYTQYACREHQDVFPLLEKYCHYSENSIPQLEDVSQFLRERTGFQLRPVAGLLSARGFLNGLAFRVFNSTQYIRHPSQPFYTPEPDVCHELLGHVPLFADHDFADFSQEIGLASLGATDEDVQRLVTIYWYTVEFGVCKQHDDVTHPMHPATADTVNGDTTSTTTTATATSGSGSGSGATSGYALKAYGAGLLSSFGELEYAMTSDTPKRLPFDAKMASETPYPITQYQPMYFVAESFANVKEQVMQFAKTMKKPYKLIYQPLTQSVDVLDDREKIARALLKVKGSMECIADAVGKL